MLFTVCFVAISNKVWCSMPFERPLRYLCDDAEGMIRRIGKMPSSEIEYSRLHLRRTRITNAAMEICSDPHLCNDFLKFEGDAGKEIFSVLDSFSSTDLEPHTGLIGERTYQHLEKLSSSSQIEHQIDTLLCFLQASRKNNWFVLWFFSE